MSRTRTAQPLVLAERAVALDRARWLRVAAVQDGAGHASVVLYVEYTNAPDGPGAPLIGLRPLAAVELGRALSALADRGGNLPGSPDRPSPAAGGQLVPASPGNPAPEVTP